MRIFFPQGILPSFRTDGNSISISTSIKPYISFPFRTNESQLSFCYTINMNSPDRISPDVELEIQQFNKDPLSETLAYGSADSDKWGHPEYLVSAGEKGILERRYLWYDTEFFHPVPTVEGLADVLKHDSDFYRKQIEQRGEIFGFDQARNPLIKIKNTPSVEELKKLLKCKLEYGIIFTDNEWLVIVGTPYSVPFRTRGRLTKESILIHNHTVSEDLAYEDYEDYHVPLPGIFDLMLKPNEGRQFLISELGLIEYRGYDMEEDKEAKIPYIVTEPPDYVKRSRIAEYKWIKDTMESYGVIRQSITWKNLTDQKLQVVFNLSQ